MCIRDSSRPGVNRPARNDIALRALPGPVAWHAPRSLGASGFMSSVPHLASSGRARRVIKCLLFRWAGSPGSFRMGR
eukprot:4979565-Alexandrium_andersonii.AAC.1